MADNRSSQSEMNSNNSRKTGSQGSNRSYISRAAARKRERMNRIKIIGFSALAIILTVVIIVVAVQASKNNNEGPGKEPTHTPAPENTAAPTESPVTENTPVPPTPSPLPTDVPTPVPTKPVTPTPTRIPTPTQKPKATNTPKPTTTPTPVVEITEADATSRLNAEVGEKGFTISLVDNNFKDQDGTTYYRYEAYVGGIRLPMETAPDLLVRKKDGKLYVYDGISVATFTSYPLDNTSSAAEQKTEITISDNEAYKILCSYSKEKLGLAKNVSEYEAEFDESHTLINNVECYRFILTEEYGGKTRNRGEFYITVDGEMCYKLNEDTYQFDLIAK